jgi:lipopolysaccharide export system permease protein
MKILDKYVAKNFLVGYGIALCVLIGLRIIIDLFVNLDQFTQHAELTALAVLKNIFIFYSLNVTLYFRDFAGMMTVVAAAFSLGKMVRLNELVAIMASGVSLKRVIGPILVLALLLTGLLVINQEILIPLLGDKLTRSQDDIPGQESYDVWFIADADGSLFCAPRFDVKTSTLHEPTIVRRAEVKPGIWQVIGRISAEKAVDVNNTGNWVLTKGRFIKKGSGEDPQPVASYKSDVTAKDIPVRRTARYIGLLGSRQLAALAAQRAKIRDLPELYSQKHFRITDPIINLVMLMVSLPVLVCREPKSMKSAVMISFGLTTACFIATFVCKMLATEPVLFGKVMVQLWAWLPIFIFVPIAFIELDSMKT